MTAPRTLDVERLLAEEPFVRRLARTLAGDEADDLAQQTFLQALRARGAPTASPRRWLAAVLRNALRNRRRDTTRQRAAEAALPAHDPAPSSHQLLEREERRRALVLAVDALPAPLRAVVLLRFFEERGPREIARRLNVPVTTVWNRQRTALQRLRARLDADHGDRRAWLLPLLAPLRRVAGAAALPGLLGTGALFLKAKTAVALLAGAAAFGLALWALGTGPAPPSGTPTGTGPGAPAPVQADLGEEAPPPGPAGADELRRSIQETTTPRPAPPQEAVLRGRCVDETGVPLAGVTVDLDGWTGNQREMDAYLRDHGEVDWQDPGVFETGPDGRFEVRFVPPPPYQFRLELARSGKATMAGRWGGIGSGEVKELGDIVLPEGVQVSGRALDEDGHPRQGVRLTLRDPSMMRTRSWLHPVPIATTQTGAGGRFRFRERLIPGTWKLGSHDAALTEPHQRAELELPTTELEVVVRRPPRSLVLAGRVVDGHGRPVAGAVLRPDLDVHLDGTRSGADGTFELAGFAQDRTGRPFALLVSKEGHERLETGPEFHWGDEHVRLVLRRRLDVEVLVRRGDDGSPVEEYGLRMFPAAVTIRHAAARWGRIRGGWHHEGGRLLLESVTRGSYGLLVEPRPDSGLARGGPVEVRVEDGLDRPIELVLAPRSRREVRVSLRDGTPVPDSTVELLEGLHGHTVTGTCRGVPLSRWFHVAADKAMLVDEGTTDARGRCVIEGPPDRAFALRLSGNHLTAFRPGVHLAGAPPRGHPAGDPPPDRDPGGTARTGRAASYGRGLRETATVPPPRPARAQEGEDDGAVPPMDLRPRDPL